MMSKGSLTVKNRAKETVFLAIITALLIIPSVSAKTYCSGDNLVEEIEINGETITIDDLECNNGCYNITISTLGNAGCRESDLTLLFYLFCLVVFIAIILRVTSK